MQSERDLLLDVLKAELKFLEEGGCHHPFRNDWRTRFIFEDSPACLNYNVAAKHRTPCADCVLTVLLPAEQRNASWLCRHIPLNHAGETLDSLYRSADLSEIEIIVRRWLQQQIELLEGEKAAGDGRTASTEEAGGDKHQRRYASA